MCCKPFKKKKRFALFRKNKGFAIGISPSGALDYLQSAISTFLVYLFSFSFLTSHRNKKPKIGLVLSGGGAKGFAHIGVLKVLKSWGPD
jgi:hypothetical protein